MVATLPAQHAPSNGREIWLDGLRGFAAAIVAWFHFTNYNFKLPYHSFWDEPAEQNRSLIQLAPFRIIFAGQAMVDIFFVISGYSVSVGLIRLRNRGSTADFYRKLTSAIFRRLFRLFFPVLVISLISHTLYFLGFYAWLFTEENGFPGCVPYSGLWCHIRWLLRTIFNLVNLQSNQNATLNDHLWTIPVEMRGSMFIYLALAGFASARADLRPYLAAFLGLRNLWNGNPEFAAFFAGLTLAELDNSTESLQLPRSAITEKTAAQTLEKLQKLRIVAKWVLFATGVYLICLPVQDPFPADWFFQTRINPPFWVEWETRMRSWQTIGAVLFIGTIRKTPILKKPFETSFAQFLGYISFSLYLLHQTFYRIALNRMLDLVSNVCLGQGYWFAEKEENNAGFVVFLAWTTATLTIAACLTMASKLMAKAVDQRSVTLAHRVERMFS
ncbi:acyltransferase 3 [Xylariaceae sp. FL0016]|nr:acyltransferase 3 [Xylariaceae sp. FL0016]